MEKKMDDGCLQDPIRETIILSVLCTASMHPGLPCIVMEYMAGGNLHSFLRNIKGAHRLSDMSSDECIQYIEKLDICRQVSMGMQFLASKNVRLSKFLIEYIV